MLRPLCLAFLLPIALGACTPAPPSWHWEHPQGLGPAHLAGDLVECRFYAGITTPEAFGAERPVDLPEWDAGVVACMAKRGWIFVETRK